MMYEFQEFVAKHSVFEEDSIPMLIHMPCEKAFIEVADLLGCEGYLHNARDYWLTDVYTKAIQTAQEMWGLSNRKIVDFTALVNYIVGKIKDADTDREQMFRNLRELLCRAFNESRKLDFFTREEIVQVADFLYDMFGSSVTWKLIRHAFSLPQETPYVLDWKVNIPLTMKPGVLASPAASVTTYSQSKKGTLKRVSTSSATDILETKEDSELKMEEPEMSFLPSLREAVSDDFLIRLMIPPQPEGSDGEASIVEGKDKKDKSKKSVAGSIKGGKKGKK